MSPEQTQKCHELFDQYHRLMLVIANDVLHDTHLAEDAVQDAFLRVMKNIEKIGEVNCSKTKNFMAIVAKNVAQTEYVKRNAMEMLQDPETMERITIQDAGISAEFKLNWEESLRSLSYPFQEVLLLTADGYSPKEIAEILEENYETIRKRLQRARTALKQIL